MAALANTFLTGDAVGNREELSDVVSRITPEDTPLYSMIGKESAMSIHPEWETDELAAPGVNITAEGDEFNFGAITPAARMGNYEQIFRKSWIVSNTQEAVDNAGKAEQIKEQKLKKGIEVRKDIELAFLTNNASVATDPRELGGLPTWLETNVSRGATTGANGGFNSGTGLTEPAVAGDKRAFTKTLLDDVAQLGYTNGANFKTLMVSPYVKSVFVTFMSDANVASFRYAASGSNNTIVATADIYEGPYGKLSVVPNRVMAANAAVASNAFLIDPEMLKVKSLRKIHNVPDIAKTGDAMKGVILGETTLKVRNEKGLGVIADLFGLTATT